MEKFFFEGFFLQASLIFALGAQNIFVLDSGINKKSPITVCFVCFICDSILILLGVWGVGSFFSTSEYSRILLGFIGVVFLLKYGISKILYKEDQTIKKQSSFDQRSINKMIVLAITFSLLNPHAYLDAFLLIGGYSAQYTVLSERLTLGAGAAIFSLVWFLFLTLASHIARPILEEPKVFNNVNRFAGCLLIFLSIKLGHDIWGWINEDSVLVGITKIMQ